MTGSRDSEPLEEVRPPDRVFAGLVKRAEANP